MYSQAEENCLKALLSLTQSYDEATINLLSKRLNIKMPTVNSMIKKLAEKQLVHYESYKPVKLTEKGKKEAALILRKHRLTEMFLVEKMGFGWEEVHPIAEQMEHIKSSRFFEKMDEILNYPQFDPHGSPIPDVEGNITSTAHLTLNKIPKNQKVQFVAVADSSESFLKFLNKKNILLGSFLEVISIEPFDKSIVIKLEDGRLEELSAVASEKMLVEGKKILNAGL